MIVKLSASYIFSTDVQNIHVFMLLRYQSGFLRLVMRLQGCATRKNKNPVGQSTHQKRAGSHSLNNGVSRPDGDPQSWRESVHWHVESTVNLNGYKWINTGLKRDTEVPISVSKKICCFVLFLEQKEFTSGRIVSVAHESVLSTYSDSDTFFVFL